MILSIEAEEGEGKTTMAYTAPGPVVGFQFDMGAERALYGGKFKDLYEGYDILMVPYDPEETEALWSGHDITIYELPAPVQMNTTLVNGSKELWRHFIRMFLKAYDDPHVSSLVFDTMTIARRVCCDARLQVLQEAVLLPSGGVKPGEVLRQQLTQLEYGRPNDAVRGLYLRRPLTKDNKAKNIIAVHHLTDEYSRVLGAGGKVTVDATGKRILEGLNNTYRFVDVAVRLSKKDMGIQMVLKKMGYTLSMPEMTIENPTWNKLVSRISQELEGRIPFDYREPKNGGNGDA